ncbi:deoxyribonuclease IV [Paenibacillus senegalensis]|uniref:deoxyribonuclease IV n=1 Tax=Paenibacillus senegalensis TaxID=1465766 RepID=UPI000288508E|nr:deoxyribonuclease IV [Paenibacillus senegalensis]
MRLGSHVSIRKGYREAAKTAAAIGGRSFQYFPKNPRGLSIKAFDPRDAEQCAQYCKEQQLISIAHSPYPSNLAAADPALQQAVVASLKNDLHIAEHCGSIGVVVHFGKSKEEDLIKGYRIILDTLNFVLEDWQGEAKLLIENQAGEGTMMGTTFEELVQIRKLAERPEKIGFCLDTCHAFASGLWKGDWGSLEQKGQELGYFTHLHAIHFNDSVYGAGERKDRHAPFGKGRIGKANLLELMTSPLLADLPFILETETGADRTHRAEIQAIQQYLQENREPL